MKKKIAVVFGIMSAFASASMAASTSEMLTNLEFMRNAFHAQYAPATWKKSFAQWDLDAQIDAAKSAISSSAEMSGRNYQKILSKLFLSARDYHTSISFVRTEKASLPFVVRGAGGRYFLAYINRALLPSDAFPFEIGDEIVKFGDQTTDEAVKALLADTIINTSNTDQERAELNLTSRQASRGMAVPKGPITITVKPKGSDKFYTRQLQWEYAPEKIPYQFLNELSAVPGAGKSAAHGPSLLNRTMLGGDVDAADGASRVENPYTIGVRKAFTPALGKKIWESDDKEPFHAYIFQNTDKKLIGYVRIPSYVANMYAKDSLEAIAHFRKIITLFESTTDGMIIDQVYNPGGSVFYLYTLVSMLSDQAVKTPRHRMMITQADVMAALTELDKIAKIKNDEDARKILPDDDLDGYPATYEVAQFMKSYCEFIISEYQAGHTLTAPYWIGGVDQINPAPEHYTKPILLLINGLDFSGGDFFPAILQDNKRVTILGTRTAGAGGYVLDFSYPNSFGIDKYRLTGSIAERVDLNPIENLGVKPDVEYSIDADDLQNNYRGYVQKILSTISTMTAQPSAK